MLKKLYQTSDGTKFYHEQDAKNHALTLKDRKVEEVDRVLTESKSEPKKDKKSAVELIAEINQVETLEALEAYEGYKQATVIKAIETKREALQVGIDTPGDEAEGTESEAGTGDVQTENE